jgi:hypothetical protein
MKGRNIMKKITFVVLISLLLLTACNFPTAQPSTDTAGVVATRVALTMMAIPTATIALPTQAVPTNTIALTTIVPTETLTITPTPTLAPADPKTTLGSPAYSNTFTSGSDFDLPYSDDAVNISAHDGTMEFKSLGVNYGLRYLLTYPKPKDFYLEGIFQTVNCSGYDHYGLVARAPNYTDGYGYYVGFSCNGQFIVDIWDNTGLSTIINWTTDSHILTGPGQTNRLGVWMKGNEVKLYANGFLIKEFTDSSITSAGHIGIYGGAVDTSNFTFKVTDIAQWNLP